MDQQKIYEELRAIYLTAREIDRWEVVKMIEDAETSEERGFWLYIADMNLKRIEAEILKE